MTSRIVLSISIAVCLIPAIALCGTTTLDPDGGIRLDGKRWFPVGIYETPSDATEFAKVKNAGFNLVRAKDTVEYLDRVRQHGLQAWIALGGWSEVRSETDAAKLKGYVDGLRNHPAIAIWELPDEALWNAEYARWAGLNVEQDELKKRVSERIESGSADAETLEDLYVRLCRCRARNDFTSLEKTIKELWTALGEPNREIATILSKSLEREGELFQNLLAGYRVLRKEDPAHLVWQNHAPRNSIDLLTKHSAYCDLIGCDIYPCPENPRTGHSDLADTSIASVGSYTKRFAQLAPDKGILMVLQGFGWKHIQDLGEAYEKTPKGREPKYLESRFMAYDAIANGANGICYWGTSYDPEGKALGSIVPVMQELIPLQDFLAAPAVTLPLGIRRPPSWTSQDRDVVWSARKVGDEWLFLFVNEEDGPQTIYLEFPDEFAGERLFFLYEGQYYDVVADAELKLDFVGYGVRILSTRDDLEVPDLRGLDREIEPPF